MDGRHKAGQDEIGGAMFLLSSLRDFPRTALRSAGEGLSEGTPCALREGAASAARRVSAPAVRALDVATSRRSVSVEGQDGAGDFAGFHLAEGFVDVAQPAALGHHVVEVEAAGGLLGIDDRGDGAEQRVTERRLERPPAEARVELQGARTRSGDRGRHDHVARGFQHRRSPSKFHRSRPNNRDNTCRRLIEAFRMSCYFHVTR